MDRRGTTAADGRLGCKTETAMTDIDPTPEPGAEKLARIRSLLETHEGSPDAVLDAIAEVIGRREPARETYQKPWG